MAKPINVEAQRVSKIIDETYGKRSSPLADPHVQRT